MTARISDKEVAAIRERHEWLRGFRDDPETGDRMSDADLDERVGQEFGVTAKMVRLLVLGDRRPDAGGPLDETRRRIRYLYHQEAASLGVTEARRRRQLRARGIDPEPKSVRWTQRAVILDETGQETGLAYTLDPGHSIRVDLVAEGGRR